MHSPKDIANLEAEIRRHLLLYHDLGTPEISDQEFDRLYEKLQKLAPDSRVLNERSQFDGDFRHTVPMGSLPKVKTAADLYKKFAGKVVTVTPKIDGAGLTNRYKSNRLYISATRGNTETQNGKNVTAVIPAISNIPNSIDVDEEIEVRGEVVILRDDWKILQVEHPELSNPRNAASGGLNSRDFMDVKERRLTFVAYKTVCASSSGTHEETLNALKRNGFMVPPFDVVKITSEKIVHEFIDKWAVLRPQLPYETDGIVIRLNSEYDFLAEGMSGAYWNGGMAFKYENEEAETVLRDIVIETGRLGFVTPVGIFDPIQLGGASVERCTLNNWEWMREHGNPSIGAKIVIAKMNDIIPNLVDVLEDGNGDTKEPKVCPSCGSTLVRLDIGDGEGKKLKCQNGRHCPAQFLNSVLNILQKLEIKGIAEAIMERIISAKLIQNPWDIFGVSYESLVSIGFGAKESKNIVSSLTGVSAKPTHILAAVGLEMWGRRLFAKLQKLSPQFTDERLLAGDFPCDEVARTYQIGKVRAQVLSDAFKPDGYGTEFLAGLLKWVHPITKDVSGVANKSGGKLTGKTFLLTGTMSKSRKLIEEDIVAASGSISSGVSKNLNYLVVGEDAGGKLDKAKKLGVPTISEDELYKMIGSV